GVNSGAGLAVTICTALGIYGGWQLSLSAFLGGFTVVMLVSLGARKCGASRGTVILIGVAVNSLLGAVTDAIVTFFPDVGVMSNNFKIGEFSAVTYDKLLPAAIAILLTAAVLLTLTNELDVLTLGDESAKGLGMNTALMRTLFLLLAALLAGCAVSLAGLVSFVGLIVPHAVRRIAGSKASRLIPLCGLFGGAFVCLCDTAARTLFAPYEIPVGIIMSFFGAPFFLFILIKGKGGHSRD
ncbi:MAG: FecCD family ABC transporter permease, partial [Ruminiclostridium sp.]